MATYNMQCPMAAHRLIRSGMPATREHEVHSARPGAPASTAVAVAETVQHFITGAPLDWGWAAAAEQGRGSSSAPRRAAALAGDARR